MSRTPFVLVFACIALSHGFHIQPRVLNGDLSDHRQFPYFVHLRADTLSCGGALISDRWILTAAHCVSRQTKVKAYFGIQSQGDFAAAATIPVSNQRMYPEYNAMKLFHDIALLELERPIAFNQHIQPAILTDNCEVPHEGDEAVIAVGRGSTVYNQPPSDPRLRQGAFTTMPSGYCSTQLLHKPKAHTIVCAHVNHKKSQTIFYGDSGGPVLRASNGHLLGIVSGTQPISHTDERVKFQIFTNVAYYYDWIERKTGLKLPAHNCPQAYHYNFLH